MEKLGGLWVNTAKSGKKYMSGSISWNNESIPIIIFKNENKKNDKSPDFIINFKEARENRPAPPPKEEFEDDIPF